MYRPGLLALAVVTLLVSDSHAQIRSVTSANGTLAAHLVPLGEPTALMTEVWLSGPRHDEPLRLGIFMGEPGSVEFLSDESALLYLEPGLDYIPNGSAGHLVASLKLVQNRIWQLPLGGPPARLWPLPDGLDPVTFAASADGSRLALVHEGSLWVVDTQGQGREVLAGKVAGPLGWEQDRISCRYEGLPSLATLDGAVSRREEPRASARLAAPAVAGPLPRSQETTRAFAEVQSHLNRWTHGQQLAYRGDYGRARKAFRKAAKGLRKVAGRNVDTGLVGGSLQGYIDAISSWNKDDEEMAAVVCREHMLVVGQLCCRFADAHGGAMPSNLEALADWQNIAAGEDPERNGAISAQLYRCPGAVGDHLPAFSYELVADSSASQPLVKCFWHRDTVQELVISRGPGHVRVTPLVAENVDSLFSVGVRRLESGDAEGAILPVRAVIHQRPGDKAGHLKMGHVFLNSGRYEAAKWAFRRAGGLDMGDAEAFYGLGLVHMKAPNERYDAISYFQKALQRNHDHADARYQIALARYAMNEHDAGKELERVLAIDPEYADAYLLMGDWCANFREDYDQAIVWYTRYLALRPDDTRGHRQFGLACLQLESYDRILGSLLDFVREHPDAIGLMPVVAQALVKDDKFDMAMGLFSTYVSRIDSDEREIYIDVRPIASDEEARAFAQTSGDSRAVFLKQFWSSRDPDITTPVNERLLEHYRRVWYSRLSFSGTKEPWDRRGEVYVRFGEPDHKSSSTMMNLSRDLEIQRVRERLAVDLYGADAIAQTFAGPVFPVKTFSLRKDVLGMENPLEVQMYMDLERDVSESATGSEDLQRDAQLTSQDAGSESIGSSDEGRSSGSDGAAAFGEGEGRGSSLSDRAQPSQFVQDEFSSSIMDDPFPYEGWRPGLSTGPDLGSTGWVTWTYLHVGGGIEITFTDESGSGAYDFAPVPTASDIPIGLVAKLHRYAPQEEFTRAARMSPDFYAPGYETEHFNFYYNLAGFRGHGGKSAVEVYFGIPSGPDRYESKADVTRLSVTRELALLPERADTVYRRSGSLVFEARGNRTGSGTVLPDIETLSVPPGEYRLEVKARDRLTGRLGIYRQQVVIPEFGHDRLQLSDLELAFYVGEDDGQGAFVKNGLKVIPMPSRTYRRGQGVFVYHEIYNLAGDEFGQSRFRVTYSLGPKAGNVLRKLVRTLTRRQPTPQVAVGFEQVGKGDIETLFTELALEKAQPGWHYLMVEVEDLVSGEKTKKETTFAVTE